MSVQIQTIAFQFQNGSIKAILIFINILSNGKFQFQNGSIKAQFTGD